MSNRTAPGSPRAWASQPTVLLTLYQIHSADGGDRRRSLGTTARARGRRRRHAHAPARHRRAHRGLRAGAVLRRQARVIGAAHAGWRGALSGIVEATVAAMEELGAKRERIVAAIGPAISQRAYEVGADYVERFLAEEPASEAFFMTDESSGEPHFDLAGYVAERLGPRPASAPSPISGFAPIATRRASSAIAGRSITAKMTTAAKFPPSCSPDRRSPWSTRQLRLSILKLDASRRRQVIYCLDEVWKPRSWSERCREGGFAANRGSICWARIHHACAAGLGVSQPRR